MLSTNLSNPSIQDSVVDGIGAAGISGGGSVLCIGDLNNFSSVLSPAFRAATVFVGLSVIVIVLCVLAFLLFLPMRSDSVFEICGTMQFLSGKTARDREILIEMSGNASDTRDRNCIKSVCYLGFLFLFARQK